MSQLRYPTNNTHSSLSLRLAESSKQSNEDNTINYLGNENSRRHLPDDKNAFRRAVYMAIMNSNQVDECVERVLELNLTTTTQYLEVAELLVDCSTIDQSREEVDGEEGGAFFIIQAERLCKVDRAFREAFRSTFQRHYARLHKYHSAKLRAICRFYSHLFAVEALALDYLDDCMDLGAGFNENAQQKRLEENHRIFNHTLMEHLRESWGAEALCDRVRGECRFWRDHQWADRFFDSLGLSLLHTGTLPQQNPGPQQIEQPPPYHHHHHRQNQQEATLAAVQEDLPSTKRLTLNNPAPGSGEGRRISSDTAHPSQDQRIKLDTLTSSYAQYRRTRNDHSERTGINGGNMVMVESNMRIPSDSNNAAPSHPLITGGFCPTSSTCPAVDACPQRCRIICRPRVCLSESEDESESLSSRQSAEFSESYSESSSISVEEVEISSESEEEEENECPRKRVCRVVIQPPCEPCKPVNMAVCPAALPPTIASKREGGIGKIVTSDDVVAQRVCSATPGSNSKIGGGILLKATTSQHSSSHHAHSHTYNATSSHHHHTSNTNQHLQGRN